MPMCKKNLKGLRVEGLGFKVSGLEAFYKDLDPTRRCELEDGAFGFWGFGV